MQLNTSILKKIFPSTLLGLSALFFVACGTHQESDYRDNDGIYNSDATVETTDDTSRDSYYKQYFNSKTDAYEDLPEEGAIFTDIDAYHTTESINKNGDIITEEIDDENYAGWGENSEEVVVNVYNNGFNNRFGGWGWGWNQPYWWYGAGWGYSNYWGGPFYGIGWGWGYPYYGNFGWGCPINQGGFYNNYNNPYYGNIHGGYALNRGRRNMGVRSGRIATATRNYNGIRNNREIAERRTSTRSDRYSRESSFNSRNTRSSRARLNTQRSRTRPNTSRRSNRSTRPRATTPRTTRPSVQSRSNSSRSRSNTSRSSSPRRSSSTRSSRGGGRSSGASRSGGSRRGGGRGN